MKTFGHLKLSTRVITHKDRHGREQGKRVSLLSHHCEFKEIQGVVAEFMRLNPSLQKQYVDMQFTVTVYETISFGDSSVGIVVDD